MLSWSAVVIDDTVFAFTRVADLRPHFPTTRVEFICMAFYLLPWFATYQRDS